MKKILLFAFIFSGLNLFAQEEIEKIKDQIVNEGKKLYRSEMASWYGSDIFMAEYKDIENSGGYVSYTEGDIAKCVFFNKDENKKVVATYIFDSTYNIRTAKKDYVPREPSGYEMILYTLRKKATEIILKDTMFKMYKKMNFNIIPLATNEENKVYVLTGPKESGVIVFGNDYLLKFDKEYKLTSKKKLHNNILVMEYGEQENEVGGMHSHLAETGDFITPTDICTLMLYAKFAKWTQHIVVSEKYMNIWNCENNTLILIPMSEAKKINKDMERRDKKNKVK